MTIELVNPDLALRDEYQNMMDDFEQNGETYWFYPAARRDFPAFVQSLQDAVRGIGLPYGFVPYTTYWLAQDGTHLMGELRLRHQLNDMLLIEGGHIGYNIRPSERRKGYGTLQLALGLEKARARGLKRVLVTCNQSNLASARIIEANGGLLSGVTDSPHSGQPVCQYWIEL